MILVAKAMKTLVAKALKTLVASSTLALKTLMASIALALKTLVAGSAQALTTLVASNDHKALKRVFPTPRGGCYAAHLRDRKGIPVAVYCW